MKINLKITDEQMISLSIVIAFFTIGLFLFPQMPKNFASHWGADGEVNGYMSQFWGVFLLPLVSLILYILFLIIPNIDPKKDVIKIFRRDFDIFIIAILTFLFYLYLLTLVWNLGLEFNMIQLILPSFGMLFYECAILTEKARQNYSIGIKTPWTLTDERVWNKTHEVGSKLFRIIGVSSLIIVLVPHIALWYVLSAILFTTIFLFSFSYFEYKKLNN